MCAAPLPPGVNPIAVNKYINISININTKMGHFKSPFCGFGCRIFNLEAIIW